MPEIARAHVPIDLALAEEAVALVRRWLDASATVGQDKAAERLASALRDPNGLAFTVGFVDGVVRPEDPRVAARNLRRLASDLPRFLPWHLRGLIRAGGVAAAAVPWLIVPVARRALRWMVRHLIVDASDRRLGDAIRHIRGGESPSA